MSFLKNLFDERFILHRLKATRFAAIFTAVAMGVYINYEMFVNNIIHWETLYFLGIMAIAKILAAIYYRFTN